VLAASTRRRPRAPVKINAVALKGVNEDEIADMIAWAHGAAWT
jgi:GTP 3',8-cyclase